MARDHVRDLFSAAYDDMLNTHDAARFQVHVEQCEACAAEYEVFRQSVDAVRAMPAARMPRPVHVPSTPPIAEQPTIAARWRGLRMPRLRLLPGAATGIAAVAAVALLILATRQGGGAPDRNSLSGAGSAIAPQSGQAAITCPTTLAGTLSAPPADYQHRVSASDPGRPGQELVVATQTGTARAGSQVAVFAQLTVPRPSIGAPGANAPLTSVGELPCLAVNGTSAAFSSPAATPGAAAGVQPGAATFNGAALPLETFTVPAGTPAGTQLHIVATVPPNYPQAGEPPLTVDLVITVQ
jgi:hypothetical protein